MNEQITMFNDPLEEKAIRTLKDHAERFGLEDSFRSYAGGTRENYSYFFNPQNNTFYYANKSFNTYEPEPWVRKKTLAEIKELFMED